MYIYIHEMICIYKSIYIYMHMSIYIFVRVCTCTCCLYVTLCVCYIVYYLTRHADEADDADSQECSQEKAALSPQAPPAIAVDSAV